MRVYRVFVSLCLWLTLVIAASVNITVDDTFGNSTYSIFPTYLPDDGTWHAGTPTEQCDTCKIKPSELDADQMLDQTWHHGTCNNDVPIQMEVTFTGTAVYVYNVVLNTLP